MDMKRTAPLKRRVRACSTGALIALACTAGQVRAEPRSWDGGGGGSNTAWTTAANWNPDGVPSSTTDVTLGSGITPSLLIGTTANFANSLTISTANPFTVGSIFTSS